jgi:DNA primase
VVRFTKALERVGALGKLKAIGDELQGMCPQCKSGGERGKSLNINTRKEVFQCFACKIQGSIVDLVMVFRGGDKIEAALWLWDELIDKQESAAESSNDAGSEAQRSERENKAVVAGDVQVYEVAADNELEAALLRVLDVVSERRREVARVLAQW